MSGARRFGGAGIRRGIRSPSAAAAAAAWDPSQAAGAQVWWRDPASVSSWVDSISGETFAQATPANQPAVGTVGGQATLQFASPDVMYSTFSTASLSAPFWMFILAGQSIAGSLSALDGDNNGTRLQIFTSATTWRAFSGGVVNSAVAHGTDGSLDAILIVSDSTSSDIYVNDFGSPVTGSLGTQIPDGFALGAAFNGSNGFSGNISELFCANGEPSAGDLASAAAYLNDRYSDVTVAT